MLTGFIHSNAAHCHRHQAFTRDPVLLEAQLDVAGSIGEAAGLWALFTRQPIFFFESELGYNLLVNSFLYEVLLLVIAILLMTKRSDLSLVLLFALTLAVAEVPWHTPHCAPLQFSLASEITTDTSGWYLP